MYYFQRVEERSKQARKTLKNCELAQRQKRFGFKEAVISSRGECTGCRNPDDGTLDRKCKRCQYNEYYEECDEYIITEEQAKRNRKKFKIVK